MALVNLKGKKNAVCLVTFIMKEDVTHISTVDLTSSELMIKLDKNAIVYQRKRLSLTL